MAFIGIRIEDSVTRLLKQFDVPGEKVADSEQHITVICFEDNWPISEVSKTMDAAFEALKDFKPFKVTIDRVSCFPKREGKPCPIIAKIDSDELHEVNTQLKKALDKVDVEYNKLFKDFKPHVTLSYADNEIDEYKIDPIEFYVYDLVLWAGDHGDDRFFITFPLTNNTKKNASHYLDQKMNMFCKLTSKDASNELAFKQSVERRKVSRG